MTAFVYIIQIDAVGLLKYMGDGTCQKVNFDKSLHKASQQGYIQFDKIRQNCGWYGIFTQNHLCRNRNGRGSGWRIIVAGQ